MQYTDERIPAEMRKIPENYRKAAHHQGKLERLDYETWESFTYDRHERKILKTAWIYLPYGYDSSQKYNIVYLSHGGWSDETTVLGTNTDPHPLKNYMDHAMEEGMMAPVIVVALTYNNTGDHDSWDYELAIELTDRFHRELVNDLIPAVEGKYHTYTETTDTEGLKNSRDHRAFGGFSMGSVNTWRTFQYCLDDFRYFMPMSGNLSDDGEFMADIVRRSSWNWNDFFIISSSGSGDFARNAFVSQIHHMAAVPDHTFRYTDNEQTGNLFYREWKNGTHGPECSDLYTWNNLLWISKRMEMRK